MASVQPMTDPIGDFKFYVTDFGRTEPSAVERLGALEDEELAERVRKHDESSLVERLVKASNMIYKRTVRK